MLLNAGLILLIRKGKRMRFILASGSPRRKELLKMIVDDFEVIVSDCEEITTETIPANITCELSKIKAEAVDKMVDTDEYIILSADTIVASDGQILGKPVDAAMADKMIHQLAGRSHQVYTGVTLIYHQKEMTKCKSFAVCTEVMVADMTEQEISEYIHTEEPYDKAGGYGIQGIFGKFVVGINGDYNNVVGLPVQKIYKELIDIMG